MTTHEGYHERAIDGPDGRRLEVATTGPASGRTVVVHHGTPGTASLVHFFDELAEEYGLFVVGLSRPGYGASTRREGRVVGSVVEDVHAVLDALRRDRYLAVGWSGGGPHAIACAALGAPRCLAAWSLAGVAPTDVDFDWTAGMGPENVAEFELARAGGPEYDAFMEVAAAVMSAATPESVIADFGGLLSPVDQAALAGASAREFMASSMREAFATGWRGFYDDDRAILAPWGFDLAAVSVPVAVWYGEHDLMVPPSHGRWLAEAIAGAVTSYFPDDGHVSLVFHHGRDLAAALADPAFAGADPDQ